MPMPRRRVSTHIRLISAVPASIHWIAPQPTTSCPISATTNKPDGGLNDVAISANASSMSKPSTNRCSSSPKYCRNAESASVDPASHDSKRNVGKFRHRLLASRDGQGTLTLRRAISAAGADSTVIA